MAQSGTTARARVARYPSVPDRSGMRHVLARQRRRVWPGCGRFDADLPPAPLAPEQAAHG